MLGVGIGMVLSTLLMFGFKYDKSISDAKIEESARALGMHFEGECKVLFEGEKVND